MELLQNLELIYDADAGLRWQGAYAAALRARRPALVEIAERAGPHLRFLQHAINLSCQEHYRNPT